MRSLVRTLLVGMGLSGCTDTTQQEEAVRPRGIYQVVAPDSEEGVPRFGPGPAHRLVFMNRLGGTYTRASSNNSSENRSTVPDGGTASVSAWSYGDADWQGLMTCVRDIYAPFDVTITDVDPGAVPHIESVVGGRPGQVGLERVTLGRRQRVVQQEGKLLAGVGARHGKNRSSFSLRSSRAR